MPISYEIDGENGCIIETWKGDITAAELDVHWRRYLADPEVMALRRTLVDLRQCRLLFTGAELSSLVQNIVVPALHGQNWRSAIVVGDPTQFGVARQYQVFAESFSSDSIFSTPEAAMAWLHAQRQPTNNTRAE